jgi:hypothetical protein
MRVTRLRASPRHGGSGSLFRFLVIEPPWGRPFRGGGGVHHKQNTREPASLSHQETMNSCVPALWHPIRYYSFLKNWLKRFHERLIEKRLTTKKGNGKLPLPERPSLEYRNPPLLNLDRKI